MWRMGHMKLSPTGFDVGYGNRSGWHLGKIPSGVLGDLSKLDEEYAEYEDAVRQNLRILQFYELSDMIGALAAQVQKDKLPWTDAMPTPTAMSAALNVTLPKALETYKIHMEGATMYRQEGFLTTATFAAQVLLCTILDKGSNLGFTSEELLIQAQLRSAIAMNSPL